MSRGSGITSRPPRCWPRSADVLVRHVAGAASSKAVERCLVGGRMAGRPAASSASTATATLTETTPAGVRDELVERCAGEDHVVADQHVVGVQLTGGDQVHLGDVAQALPAGDVLGAEHHEDVLRAGDGLQRADRGLGRRGAVDRQGGQHVHVAAAGPIGQGAAQCGGLHLLRGALGVAVHGRAVHDAAAVELRRAGTSPGVPYRCPFGGTASCRRRTPHRGSWSCACPAGRRPAGPPRPGASAARWR